MSGEVQRQRALVELSNLDRKAVSNGSTNATLPLIERLHEYPTEKGGLDLKNLVSYPPKLEPVPVKPLFFDVAWNYIEYPGRKPESKVATGTGEVKENESQSQTTQQKKGWFGFGRG